jgi:DNA (cytosine-5)-methyltransferase 1
MKKSSPQVKKKIKVAELFAGVGGFRVGLERLKGSPYKIVWSNQWEPATVRQHASDIYSLRFGKEGHSNKDLAQVSIEEIPDHHLLVGGFPCQDYSVARTLSHAEGLKGKKGVLWWQIHRILEEKGDKAPPYLMLENVDRLLKSPASQRGRDFAVMLASLADLGYAVEWRVINAADYGMPQRRRRIYILGYKNGTDAYRKICADHKEWAKIAGPFARGFKAEALEAQDFVLEGHLHELTERFNKEQAIFQFKTGGIMVNRQVHVFKAFPSWKGRRMILRDIVNHNEKDVPEEYFIEERDFKRWVALKGAKKEMRKTKSGFEYLYSEGPIAFPDPLDKPSRTIVTGEGGSSPSRFKHVIKTKSGRYRRLMPEELEKLNMFPSGHTKEAVPTKRAFFMGNALVVGIVEKLGKELLRDIGFAGKEKTLKKSKVLI